MPKALWTIAVAIALVGCNRQKEDDHAKLREKLKQTQAQYDNAVDKLRLAKLQANSLDDELKNLRRVETEFNQPRRPLPPEIEANIKEAWQFVFEQEALVRRLEKELHQLQIDITP